MAQIIVKEIDNQKLWETFLIKHPEANFLQSWYWGEFHQALNKKIVRLGFFEEKQLLGVMLCIIEKAKRATYLTVPGGPIVNWHNPKLVEIFVETIQTIAQKEHCVFVRVRPQLITNEFSEKLFKTNRFISAPMHLHAELTLQLDITPDETTLLSRMRKATRYEIKKALSLPITITSTENPAELKQFYELQLTTAKRQHFVPFSYAFLHEQFSVFAKEKKALLYSAYFEKKLLAQAFIIFYGNEAAYHYGASTDEGRKFPGAYLIQWKAIQEAKKRGMKRYNFWGIAPVEEKDHRFAGVSLFKRGFGGEEVTYLHAQDLIINKPQYILNFLIESLRRCMRRV